MSDHKMDKKIFLDFLKTFPRVWFKPTAFFTTLRPPDKILPLILFIFGNVALYYLLSFLYLNIVQGGSFWVSPLNLLVPMFNLLVPMLTYAACMFTAHSILALFKTAKYGIMGTFSIVAYSTVTLIAWTIPIYGMAVWAVWSFVFWVIGFRHVHQAKPAVAILAAALSFVGYFLFQFLLFVFLYSTGIVKD